MEKQAPATEADDLRRVSHSEKDLEVAQPPVLKGELADDPDAGLSEEEEARIVSHPLSLSPEHC